MVGGCYYSYRALLHRVLAPNHAAPMVRRAKSDADSRCLLLGTRGLKARHRHLLRDLLQLLPHGKLGSKLPTDEGLSGVLEVPHPPH